MKIHLENLRYFFISFFATTLIFAVCAAFYTVEYNTKQNGFFSSSDIVVYSKYNGIVEVGLMGNEKKFDLLNLNSNIESVKQKLALFMPPKFHAFSLLNNCFDFYTSQFFYDNRNFLYNLKST